MACCIVFGILGGVMFFIKGWDASDHNVSVYNNNGHISRRVEEVEVDIYI